MRPSGIVGQRETHGQVAAGGVVVGGGQVRVAVVLGFEEVREDLVPGPAVVALRRPVVVVVPVAAHVQHVVEHGRSADHFAPRPRTPAPKARPTANGVVIRNPARLG